MSICKICGNENPLRPNYPDYTCNTCVNDEITLSEGTHSPQEKRDINYHVCGVGHNQLPKIWVNG